MGPYQVSQAANSQSINIMIRPSFRFIIWTLYLLLTFFIMWKFLLNPTFALVDDAYSLAHGRSLIVEPTVANWSHTLVETSIGRFRPAYLLYFSIVYILFGSDPIGLWFFQSIAIWFTMGVLFETLFFLTKKKLSSAIFPFIWIFMPAVIENMLRMG